MESLELQADPFYEAKYIPASRTFGPYIYHWVLPSGFENCMSKFISPPRQLIQRNKGLVPMKSWVSLRVSCGMVVVLVETTLQVSLFLGSHFIRGLFSVNTPPKNFCMPLPSIFSEVTLGPWLNLCYSLWLLLFLVSTLAWCLFL